MVRDLSCHGQAYLALTALRLTQLSANRRFQAPGQVVFIRTHVAPYFLSLLFCDFWQCTSSCARRCTCGLQLSVAAIGSLLSVHWVSNGRVFLGSTCTAQGMPEPCAPYWRGSDLSLILQTPSQPRSRTAVTLEPQSGTYSHPFLVGARSHAACAAPARPVTYRRFFQTLQVSRESYPRWENRVLEAYTAYARQSDSTPSLCSLSDVGHGSLRCTSRSSYAGALSALSSSSARSRSRTSRRADRTLAFPVYGPCRASVFTGFSADACAGAGSPSSTAYRSSCSSICGYSRPLASMSSCTCSSGSSCAATSL